MTVQVSVYVPEGIVMATDSRLTVTYDNKESGKVEKYTHSDNTQKLFLLRKRPIGISTAGEASINNIFLSQYLKKFEDDFIEPNDTLETIGIKLMTQLKQLITSQDFKLHLCGYENNTPYVYLIDKFGITRYNYSEDKIQYNVLWSGHAEAIANLLQGTYPAVINFYFMPLKDAIDFADFLVDLVIKFERFKDGLSTCGGPIDILVLTSDGAKFYRHKLLNP